jgi:hypothetical protein
MVDYQRFGPAFLLFELEAELQLDRVDECGTIPWGTIASPAR